MPSRTPSACRVSDGRQDHAGGHRCAGADVGPSIVGFGHYHYRYESGREGDWFLTGFSPRKQSLTLYIMSGFRGYPSLMKRLGKYTTGRSCLYLRRLQDVDLEVLTDLIESSVEHLRRTNS